MQVNFVANSSTVKELQSVYTEVMEITKVFAGNLRRLREQNDWSADYLGAKVGVTGKHIYDLEKERKKPSIELLESLAKQFSLPPGDLLREQVVRPVLTIKDVFAMALCIPNEIYLLACELGPDDEVWHDIERELMIAVEQRKLLKG